MISDDCDKGKAVAEFVRISKEQGNSESLVTIGLGDSPNDFDMLNAVEYPYQVQKTDGTWEKIEIEDLNRVSGIGPHGWNLAINQMLGEIELEAS